MLGDARPLALIGVIAYRGQRLLELGHRRPCSSRRKWRPGL